MQSGVESGTLPGVTHEERGKEIARRRMAHGLRSVREFAERTGLSREAVTKAERGDASEGTYQRLESWLDAFDEEVGDDTSKGGSGGLVTFRAQGVFGAADVTVAGPVENTAELAEQFARLLDNLRRRENGDV